MKHLLRSAFLCVVLAFAAGPVLAGAATEFARIARDQSGRPVALQVAVVRYAPAGDGFSVDLVGAIHIGDEAYYESLNERFRDYDSLLFEMVIPDEGPPAGGEGKGGMSFISVLQKGLKDVLGLTYQLDVIDYAAPNFVHADLSSGMLLKSMQDRGESLYVYFWRLFFASMEEYAKDPLGMRDWQLLAGLLRSGDGDALKIALAEELLASMRSGDLLGGEDGSAIIAARNEHAVGVLEQELAGDARRLGIFYGVAHMADFERRLVQGLGLVKTGTEWVDAWRFAPPTADP